MKKIIKLILILVITLLSITNVYAEDLDKSETTPSMDSLYKTKNYVIDAMDVNIKVNENNSYDITENITANFLTPKHGIFRKLPLRNIIEREDGSKSRNNVIISNLKVSDKYTTSKNLGNYEIKIGDPSKELTGLHKYTIKYNYNIGLDPLKNKDELYFNIIGTEWDTAIGNITFTVTMPKSFDKSKLGLTTGYYGSTKTEFIKYNVTGNTIKGSYERFLSSYEGLTIRCELPDNYFSKATYIFDSNIILMFIIPLAFLIFSYLLWKIYGKDDKVIDTVEFYPPENMNSLEVGYAFKGRADSKDVISLLIYLANKGYLQISESKTKQIIGYKEEFTITKLKDYDGANLEEKLFFNGLFKNSSIKNTQFADPKYQKNESVTSKDLKDNFYLTLQDIFESVNTTPHNNKYFKSGTIRRSAYILLMCLLSMLTIILVPAIGFIDSSEIRTQIFVTSFLFAIALTIYSDKANKYVKILIGLIFLVIYIPTISISPLFSNLSADKLYIVGFLFGTICSIIMVGFAKYLPKRNSNGNQLLGKLNGFKNFLETAEKSKLETLVSQNPTYFYDILPYTYVLGVSDKWISKFETISMEKPTWYYTSSNDYSPRAFNSFMNSTMVSVSNSMTSQPYSSSSGGFSGGGFSGGGSGGGGGGSW